MLLYILPPCPYPKLLPIFSDWPIAPKLFEAWLLLLLVRLAFILAIVWGLKLKGLKAIMSGL